MRSWTIPHTLEAQIFEIRVEHRVAQQAGRLAALFCSFNLIKDIVGVDWHTAKAAVDFAKSHPDDAKRFAAKRAAADKSGTKVGEIASKVIDLARQKVPLSRIAEQLGVSHATAAAAFDYLLPSVIQKAGKVGGRPRRSA